MKTKPLPPLAASVLAHHFFVTRWIIVRRAFADHIWPLEHQTKEEHSELTVDLRYKDKLPYTQQAKTTERMFHIVELKNSFEFCVLYRPLIRTGLERLVLRKYLSHGS